MMTDLVMQHHISPLGHIEISVHIQMCALDLATTIYTTGKKYGIFFILAIACIFCGVCRVFLYLKYISTTCQSQSGVPEITLSCYKALSKQKYKVWSHFPLKPHYNTPRHLMIWFKSVRHTKILHRESLKAEKIKNFSVMRLHLEKAPQTTQFYNIYSINNALLNTWKIPSIFLGFSCFLFHDEIFFVSNLRPRNEYTYIVIFFLNLLNLIYNNQLLLENHTLTSYKWHSDTTIACEKWHY